MPGAPDNRVLAHIKRLFRWAVGRDLIEIDPAAHIESRRRSESAIASWTTRNSRRSGGLVSHGWWQVIRVLSGRDAGNNDLAGITETAGPEIAPQKLIDLLAAGCGTAYGVPFDGQVPEPITARARPHIHIEFRSGLPFAIGLVTAKLCDLAI